MTRTRGDYGLEAFVTEGQILDAVVVSPHKSEVDSRVGGRLLTERCAVCHGGDGSGWHGGPPVNQSRLKHGDSDFALYKVVRDGISGTSMAPADLTLLERWQVVNYIALQAHGSGAVSERTHLDIQVGSERLRAAGSRTD